MTTETANKLKKILPFLKNVDFEDPKTKKSMTYVILLAVLVLLLVVALVFRAVQKNKTPDDVEVELLQGAPRDPNAPDQTQTSPLLEIPEGQDRDVLGADNMMEAYGDRRGRRQGNRDIYESADRGGEDPLGDILSGRNGYKGYDTPGSAFAAKDDTQDDATGKTGTAGGSKGGAAYRRSPSEATRSQALAAFGLGSEDTGGESSDAPYANVANNVRSRREEASYQQPTVQQVAEEEEEAEAQPAPEPTRVRRPNGITTLDDMISRESVLTSLTHEGTDDRYIDTSDDALFKVMFLEGKKLKNGDKVRIMLIDDIVVDGVLVEHNTPLTATCALGDRLMLTVPSVTINGRIHTLNFSAVDNDGQLGLYCPVTDTAVKAEQALDAASTVAQSEILSMISGVGGRLMQSGARALKSGSKGSSTVTVDQGYQFYITKAKKNQLF